MWYITEFSDFSHTFLWLALDVFVISVVNHKQFWVLLCLAHFQALIEDNFGILAFFQALIADNFGILSTYSGINCGQVLWEKIM